MRKGQPCSEDMKSRLRSLKRTDEQKARMSAAMRGKKHAVTPAVLAAQEKRRGVRLSEETCRRMSIAMTGAKHSPERNGKIAAQLRGRKLSESHIAKLRDAWERRRTGPEIATRKERDAQIVQGFLGGMSRMDLATKYGCSNDNISRICREAGVRREALQGEAKRQSKLKSKRNYRRAHPDRVAAQLKRWCAENVESCNERRRKWQSENREKMRISGSIYQARRRALLAMAPSDSRAEIRTYFKTIKTSVRMRCYWCRTYVPKAERQVDHIIPVTKGGGTVLSNLCCACGRCNRKKSARMPENFSGQYEIHFS